MARKKPAPKSHYSAEDVAEIFAECLGPRRREQIRQPESDAFLFLAHFVTDQIANPWTDESVQKMTKVMQQRQDDRRKLNAAAAVLRRERDRLPKLPAFDAHRDQYNSALALLRRPRGVGDSGQILPFPSGTKQRQSGKAVCAGRIAEHLRPILHSQHLRMSLRADGYAIAFIRQILGIIYPNEKLPANSTIKTMVEKYLGKD